MAIGDAVELVRLLDHYGGAERAAWFDLDPVVFDAMLARFRRHMTDFTGFEATTGICYTAERRSKDFLIARRRAEVLPPLRTYRDGRVSAEAAVAGSSPVPTTPVAAGEPVQNLLGWRYVALVRDLVRRIPETLATTQAEIFGARRLVVPVAPNWTSNEDLLGFRSPLDDRYRDTEASRFLREAAAAWRSGGRDARAHHLVLDEMNLARVEYHFARLLSAMETRDGDDVFRFELAAADVLELEPNLHVIGTVNIDETTHGFADKVYDRAQTIEIEASEEMIADALGDRPWKPLLLLTLWRAGHGVAPFAFRTLADLDRYATLRIAQGDPWQEAVDETVLQKILPKAKGGDPAVEGFLTTCLDVLPETFVLARTRAARMLKRLRETGHGGFH
ncbi:MAG: hypothetical protein GX458_17170 [Phyllobacteriaceae bacterium]|nr:hypothetical protein [Phyllobacteriaceae bacterium]